MKIYPIEDTQTILHNPDLGWIFYDNYIINPRESTASEKCALYGYDFPGVETVILKYTWADIEPTKDAYTFEKFDYIYDYWKSRGKRVELGMSVDSLLWYGENAIGVPKYVVEALPEESVQHRVHVTSYNPNPKEFPYDVCNANEPYFMERMKAFLKAMADHMTETGRTATYIDLRGYGLWGEWHQGYKYETLEEKREALDKIMEAWCSAFPDAWLALSYSYDPDEPVRSYNEKEYYHEYLYWSAFDLAKKYPNLTLRRDGCGGAIQKNERIYCEEMFAPLDRGPFTAEAAGGYSGYNQSKWIIDDGLTLHPNYFTIIGWANQGAKDFIEKEPELFRFAHNNMGYRFVATQVTYPDAITRDGELELTATWLNRAVGRAARNYSLQAILTNGAGEKVATIDLGETGCSKWVKGGEYTETLAGKVPGDLTPGAYQINIAMLDPKTGKHILLAIEGKQDENPWYSLGEITVL